MKTIYISFFFWGGGGGGGRLGVLGGGCFPSNTLDKTLLAEVTSISSEYATVISWQGCTYCGSCGNEFRLRPGLILPCNELKTHILDYHRSYEESDREEFNFTLMALLHWYEHSCKTKYRLPELHANKIK